MRLFLLFWLRFLLVLCLIIYRIIGYLNLLYARNLSQNATFSSVLAEILGNSAAEDYICKKERQL